MAENLRRATSVVTLTPREGAGAVSGPRSDEVDYDEDELQSVITSSKVTVAELEGDARADSQVSKITDPEEAGKPRRQSRSKKAKKAAKTRRRVPSPGPSVLPGPDRKPSPTWLRAIGRPVSASRMESLMFQMGQEHLTMVKFQEAEKKLMKRENLFLKRTLGLVRRGRGSATQQESGGTADGQAAGSQQGAGDDREVQSRPNSAHPKD